MSTDRTEPTDPIDPDRHGEEPRADAKESGTDEADVEAFFHAGAVPRADTENNRDTDAGTDRETEAETKSDTSEEPVAEAEPSAARAEREARFAQQAAAETTVISREAYVSQTRRSVLTGAAAVAAGAFGWVSIQNQREVDNIPAFLRGGFAVNEAVWGPLYDAGRLAPEFPLGAAEDIRVNGRLGLSNMIDLNMHMVRIRGADGDMVDEVVASTLFDGLPQVDQVTEHKCIEGWSNIVHWTGVRFADVATRYPELMASSEYVALETPDGEYYVGLDMDTVMHPQSLLAHSWNGQPLTQERGAPLRLVTPLHYGIKSIKRIGTIRFTNERPRDYWAERGYDWDSSH